MKMKMTIPMMAAVAALAGCATCPNAPCGGAPTAVCPKMHAAAPNTLTDAEKAAGWKLLWDGRTLDGWVGEKGGCKAPPSKGWKIGDGVLTVLPRARITPEGK